MAMRNDEQGYGSVARTLHWLMALLVIGTILVAEARGYAPRGSDLKRGLGNVHYQIGVGIFILVWIRLAWRLREAEPPITPPLPPWQRTLSHLGSWALYALMIALPVLGILARQSEGAAVQFLGWTLPTFIANDKALSRQLEDVHTFFGNVMIWLVVLHIAAALYHALVRRDNAVARMVGTAARRSLTARAAE